MYKNILIPISLDNEEMVPSKIAVARRLLDDDGVITLLTVLEAIPGFVAEFADVKEPLHISEKVRERLENVAMGAEDIQISVVTGKPGVMIAAHARDHSADLIIVGSHHPKAQDYFLGSTASRVARRAPCSVMILR